MLIESNVIGIYKLLKDKQKVDEQEKEEVIKRFWELVNYIPGKTFTDSNA